MTGMSDQEQLDAFAALGGKWTGAETLDAVHAAYTRYVLFPSPEAADAVVLFTAATHAQTAWEHATRLCVKSPIKRCGKTRLQEVARELVHNPIPTTNISPAALARSITEDDPPTLILDEADSVWGRKEQRAEGSEDLRGILNAGHSRGWPYVRWDATARRREMCPTFCMAIIGGIGNLPDTLEDRGVVIAMRRRGPGETVTQWRTRRAVPQLRELRARLHEWVESRRDALADAEPALPAEDRAADVWEPLVAVADAAGGDWPHRARQACKALTGEAPDDADDAGERLLGDLYDVWGGADQLPTAVIIDRLCGIEEAPWAKWHKDGSRLSPRGLAGLLRPFRIRSGNVRLASGQAKGYARADLADAWERYVLPARTVSVSSVPPSQTGETAGQPRDGCGTDTDSPSVPDLWDGYGTDTGADIRPAPDLQEQSGWDGGTDGTDDVRPAGTGDPAEPRQLRDDTREEQQQLYPHTLAKYKEAWFWPARAEWAAPEQAAYEVQTQCLPSERVPSGAEHYLTPAELGELGSLYRELCQSARPLVTAEINRLRARFPGRPSRTREYLAWYDALPGDDQEAAQHLAELESARTDLTRAIRGTADEHEWHNPLREVAEFITDQDKLNRWQALAAKAQDACERAAGEAEAAAIAAEQARRQTDEGWAGELARREQLEDYWAGGWSVVHKAGAAGTEEPPW